MKLGFLLIWMVLSSCTNTSEQDLHKQIVDWHATNKTIPVYRCNCHTPPHVALTYKELRAMAKKFRCSDWKEVEVNGL